MKSLLRVLNAGQRTSIAIGRQFTMLKLSLFRAIIVKTFWLSQGSVSPSRRILCTRLSHVHRHPRTSVGLRRIVGTCQDPWSLASFPLPSSLDPIIRLSRTYADSRWQSLLFLCTPAAAAVVFLHTRIFNGTLVACVFSRKCQCGQICSLMA